MNEPDNNPVELSDVLKDEVIKQWMEEIIQEENLQNSKITVSAGSAKGENYLGIISKIVIKGKHNKRKKSIHLILKEAAKVEGCRNVVIPVQKAYQREIFMYTNILPEFKKFQKAKGCDDLFNQYATYLRSNDEYLNEYILMKDVKKEGFKMKNRKDILDYNHTKLVLENLARFHSLSYAMKKHHHEYHKIISNVRDLTHYFMTKEMVGFFKNLSDKAANTLDQVNEANLVIKFKNYMDNKMEDNVEMLCNPDTYDEFATLCHGDCWTNNILFKYDDLENPTKPTNMCFLDWQIARYASPVLDISYFVYNCTGTALRNAHFDEFMDFYYLSLSDALVRLDCVPHIVFPRKVFDEHLVKFSRHGLHMALMAINLFVSDSDELPDFTEMTGINDEFTNTMMYKSKNHHHYIERMGGILRHALKKGYI